MALHADRDSRAVRYLRNAAQGRSSAAARQRAVSEVPGALVLGEGRVTRGIVWLERDTYGQLTTRPEQLILALAHCDEGHRIRVLPNDVPMRKHYALPVIEHEVSQYNDGTSSLREVAWLLLGERTPQHTTLHGWTEGLGAHVLGREALDGEPHSAMVAVTLARWPSVATSAPGPIDPRRYRSEPRRERLLAVSTLLAMAAVIPISSSSRLAEWRRLAISFGISSPLSFRSGRLCTAIEQVGSPATRSCRACPNKDRRSSFRRTRSPPGDSNRSPPSSIPPSTTPTNDA